MAEKPTADAILNEARGAHATSREILDLMQEPSDDPIQVMLAVLQAIQDAQVKIQESQQKLQNSQQAILTRLDVIERRLASPG